MVINIKKIENQDSIINTKSIDDQILYNYTKPLTLIEFLDITNEDKDFVRDYVDQCFSEDSFIRKDALGAGIFRPEGDIFQYEGQSIFDALMNYSCISLTEQSHEDIKDEDELKRTLCPIDLFTLGGDCKKRAIFLINELRNMMFPSRLIAGYLTSPDSGLGHLWIETNYSGDWVPFEPHMGFCLDSNNEAVNYYKKYSTIRKSKP